LALLMLSMIKKKGQTNESLEWKTGCRAAVWIGELDGLGKNARILGFEFR